MAVRCRWSICCCAVPEAVRISSCTSTPGLLSLEGAGDWAPAQTHCSCICLICSRLSTV